MKNRAESVQTTTTHEKPSAWRRLVAIGALSTVALTGCATNAEAQPEPTKQEQATETPEPTEEAPKEVFETEVPKFRENWDINREALISLSEMFDEKGAEAYGDPEFIALQTSVREEFLADNPVPGDVPRPADRHASNEEILAWYDATTQLYREYVSDEERAQLIESWNRSSDPTQSDPQYAEDLKVLKGVEIALFNGVSDDLSVRDPFLLYMMDAEGQNDAPLPTITREFVIGQLTSSLQDSEVRAITSEVTVEGKPPVEVVNRFDWTTDNEYWSLTAELSSDGSSGQKLY